ncbi:hypothetical protein HFE03_07600 [Paenibacillus sp. EKM102P]|uniref:hypothetical protein n=1 Tax=unclassified Paenibacillus TaxID=185978 RepID=UPI00142D76F5|nr:MULTISPECIES: hypothetical protein [unclassified Paenibacillus]KAF6620509.1 hypothetical protein HFE00_05505 [Paenibacillus sp. EKM101P]KAF6623501.1 hypothetical protein HFE03_07600 [Paenibacillus sp. EKM102P]KAF6633935.1 hypothetical protein HFE01_06905 [Paenibacillus sp. EKM10P]KAF6649463.1 hypothetical protein HFE02_01870 [Paenibacillus sp. EKM11P]
MANEKTLQEAENTVHIEGTIKEVRIEEGTLPDKREVISGEIDIQVDENSVHTVHLFSFKYKQDKSINGIYKGIKTMMDEYKTGDKVRITQGSVRLNEYVGGDGLWKSYPQINTNFVNRVKESDVFEPKANFSFELFVISVKEEIKNDESTGRAIIKGLIPIYGGAVIPFEVVAADPKAVAYVTDTYEKGNTVSLHGVIVNQEIINRREIETGFGEPQVKIDRKTVREYLVKGGSAPYDEDSKNAFDPKLVAKALKVRESEIEEKKEKKKSGQGNKNSDGGFGKNPFDEPTKIDPFSDSKPINISEDDLPF